MKLFLILIILVAFISADTFTLEIVKDPTRGKVSSSQNEITYTHREKDKLKKIEVDSFDITPTDEAGNKGNTVTSYVLIIPETKLELYAVNNPLQIIGNNVKELKWDGGIDLSAYDNGAGVVFVVNGNVDITGGRIVIYDALGNVINNSIKLRITNGDNITAIGFWDGRNRSGRIAGSGAFAAYIELTYERDNNLSLPKGFEYVRLPRDVEHKFTANKMIGIKY